MPSVPRPLAEAAEPHGGGATSPTPEVVEPWGASLQPERVEPGLKSEIGTLREITTEGMIQ